MALFKDYILFEISILAYTWQKTKEFSKNHFFIAIFVSVVSAVAVFLTNPLEQFGQLQSSLFVLLIAFLLMFVLVLLWYLFTAPFILWQKQKIFLAELQSQSENKTDKQTVLALFHKMADFGNSLLVKRITDNDEFKVWKRDLEVFRNTTIRLIRENISRTEAIGFNVTSIDLKKNYQHRLNQEHNIELARIEAQMSKLIEIIRTYESRA